jgi:tetratricopeptide (TPR) repeat protein
MYKKSIDLNTTRGENYFRIGQVHYYKKNGRLAIENFNRALENDTNLKFAYYHIGLSYLMLLRDKQNTITNWETYLKIAPEDPQYEQIRRAIELLKDPNFVIPPIDSDTSLEEALRIGGLTLDKIDHKTRDKQADHEKKKTKKKIEDLYLDDDL